jgi:endonuclease/exonuclease/phosphatase family metal-dependent hydrolase
LTVVQAGGRLPKAEAQSWRIATWNIRWFPRGSAPGESASTPTDLEWLACAITWLDADLVAVQEMLRTQQAEEALGTLLRHLAMFTGQPWSSSFQQCGGASAQHVGFLWNAGRVDLTGGRDEWRLNGVAQSQNKACAGNLRPGYYGYARSLGGGADFHVIVVHSDSGRADRDIGNREQARNRIGAIANELAPTDRDIVILGDFNTMGADSGKSAEQEIDELRKALEGQRLPFRHLTLENQCTEYFEGHGGWLDHIVATQVMEELRPTTARVSGYCAVAQCRPVSDANMPAAYKNLSDHCPVVVDLSDADQD